DRLSRVRCGDIETLRRSPECGQSESVCTHGADIVLLITRYKAGDAGCGRACRYSGVVPAEVDVEPTVMIVVRDGAQREHMEDNGDVNEGLEHVVRRSIPVSFRPTTREMPSEVVEMGSVRNQSDDACQRSTAECGALRSPEDLNPVQVDRAKIYRSSPLSARP